MRTSLPLMSPETLQLTAEEVGVFSGKLQLTEQHSEDVACKLANYCLLCGLGGVSGWRTG